MKVKLLVARAGDMFVQNAGQVVDVSPREARRMVDSEQAEAVDKFPPEFAKPGSAAVEGEPGFAGDDDKPARAGAKGRKPASDDDDSDALT